MAEPTGDPGRGSEIAVIGGGPAGLFCAERLAGAGRSVTLFERMPTPGRKFLLAGRGGLNLTHSEPLEAFKTRYGPELAALEPSLEAFPPGDLRAWCHGLGIETFVGSSGRVFPRSFKASPVLRAWLTRLAGAGVTLRTGWHWQGWTGTGALRFAAGPGAEPREFPAPRAMVLALGGASWPRLGSDGGWTGALEAAGVPLRPLAPANSGFRCAWSQAFASRFAGTPLKTVTAGLGEARVRGQVTVTASGLEGGAIYALSRDLRERLERGGAATLTLDLCPDLTADALAARLAKVPARQSASNRLRKAGLPPVALGLVREVRDGPPPAAPPALAALLKALPLKVTATTGLERAISTAGGVSWSGLDDHLMLTARPGTFVAGEMIDWEAPTGGYLLQACFATGRRAAEGVEAYLARTQP